MATVEVKSESGRRHIAGPLVGGVQHCTRCCGVLTDYRNCMVEVGSDPLRGWEVGAWIEVRGSFMSRVAPGDNLLSLCDLLVLA